MNTPTCPGTAAALRPSFGFGWLASAAIAVPMVLLSALLLLQQPSHLAQLPPVTRATFLLVWAVFNALFFAMVKTGRTERYRATLFIAVAISFALTFIPHLLEIRGHVSLTQVDALQSAVPFCHIAIPALLIPAAFKQTLVFPGSLVDGHEAIGTMLVLWAGAALVLGRGWCSWVCFFGGLEDGCARLRRQPVLKRIDRRWTHLPVAVLLAVVLLSAATLSPAYCEWLCPFKTITEFDAVTSFKILVQTVIFVSLFAGLVVVLPILTRKRTQCAFLCPMGATLSLTNHLNLHRLVIDPERCTRCGLCVKSCPTLSLTPESVAAGRTLSTCSKCGRCVDACPRGAIRYQIRGTGLRAHPRLSRLLFLFPAMLLLCAVGGPMIAHALARLVKLATTGSLL